MVELERSEYICETSGRRKSVGFHEQVSVEGEEQDGYWGLYNLLDVVAITELENRGRGPHR